MELFAQDKLDEAIAAYQRALEEDANYADALLKCLDQHPAMNAKRSNVACGTYDAIAAGKRLIEAAPDDELAYTSLSIFYQQKGMIAEAEHVGAKARTLGWKRQLGEKKDRENS
ncbi:MAG: TPR repeat protein [Deltaproteobacteria bacterium]|nr:TPR repeat protein [Deltaproteobacteria bacterium]